MKSSLVRYHSFLVVTTFRDTGRLGDSTHTLFVILHPRGPEAPRAVLLAKKPWIIKEVSQAISCTRSTPLGIEVSKIQILSSIRITETEAINFKHK